MQRLAEPVVPSPRLATVVAASLNMLHAQRSSHVLCHSVALLHQHCHRPCKNIKSVVTGSCHLQQGRMVGSANGCSTECKHMRAVTEPRGDVASRSVEQADKSEGQGAEEGRADMKCSTAQKGHVRGSREGYRAPKGVGRAQGAR